LVRQTNTTQLCKNDDGLIEGHSVSSTGRTCDGLLHNNRSFHRTSLGGNVWFPVESTLFKSSSDSEPELSIGKVANFRTCVEVFTTSDHRVRSVAISSTIDARSGELMHINHHVRIIVVESLLDVSRLLFQQLWVVSIRIDVASEFALEIVDSIGVVACEYKDVHPLEKACRPCAVCVHLSEQCHDALVASRLVSMDLALDVHTKLGLSCSISI
jgi:hypothetical protein